jgi:glycosyltransferase involved in cell wall biosynthesis
VRFTFMGSVNRLKNLRVVLDAMRMTRGAAKLDVHGRRQDPREAARLERAARADVRIRYRGPYSEDDLPDILARTDVGLVPSLTESFSLVVREFLAAEIPVFAAGAGALPEAVGRGGALFDPDDAPGLAALMQGVIDESGQVERMRAGIAPVRGMADDAAWWERVYAGEDRA